MEAHLADEAQGHIHLNFKFSKKAILLLRNPRRTGTGLAGEAMGMACD